MPGQSNWVNRDATNWSIDSRRSNQPQAEEEGVRWGRQFHCMPSHSQSCLGHINRDYQRTRDRSLVQQRASCKLTLIYKENQRQTETYFHCKKLKS